MDILKNTQSFQNMEKEALLTNGLKYITRATKILILTIIDIIFVGRANKFKLPIYILESLELLAN